MLAYFTASIAGKKYHVTKYQAIVTALEARGIEVIAEHILSITEHQLKLKTKPERLKFHRQLENWINSADFMVAETSFPSISVGYEIFLALNRGKPVLVLYSEGDPPALFAYHESEKIVCERYTLATLDSILADFLLYVKGGTDTRFTFFISSKMTSYLDQVSQAKRIPKAADIRSLIKADMDKST